MDELLILTQREIDVFLSSIIADDDSEFMKTLRNLQVCVFNFGDFLNSFKFKSDFDVLNDVLFVDDEISSILKEKLTEKQQEQFDEFIKKEELEKIQELCALALSQVESFPKKEIVWYNEMLLSIASVVFFCFPLSKEILTLPKKNLNEIKKLRRSVVLVVGSFFTSIFSLDKKHRLGIPDDVLLEMRENENRIDEEFFLCPQKNKEKEESAKCIAKIALDIKYLIEKYPPKYANPSKERKYEEARKFKEVVDRPCGTIIVSRWKFESDFGTYKKGDFKIEVRDDFFCYDDAVSKDDRIFYLNYADSNLFGYYGSDLFAQDEIQTLEHPLLGSVLEYIDKNEVANFRSFTEEGGEPTPFVVERVPYWLSVNTNPVLPNGKVENLYSWNFSKASKKVIDIGVKVVKEEKRNNIVAMAAPSGGNGEYTKKQLEKMLKTVVAAFGGAVRQTAESGRLNCVIHTGNWGAGVA